MNNYRVFDFVGSLFVLLLGLLVGDSNTSTSSVEPKTDMSVSIVEFDEPKAEVVAPNGEKLTVATIADQVRATIDEKSAIEITSRQKLRFLSIDLSSGQTEERDAFKAIELAESMNSPSLFVINVSAMGFMSKNFLQVNFWRDDVLGRAQIGDPPLTTTTFVAGVSYELHSDPNGRPLYQVAEIDAPVGDWMKAYPVLQGIPRTLGFPRCDTSEMWRIWQGDYSATLQKVIREGSLAEETILLEGRPTYKITRTQIYEDTPEGFESRVDIYYVDSETFEFRRHQILRVGINPRFMATYHVNDSWYQSKSVR